MARPNPRILVVAPNWLGDAVMSLPLIGFLAAAGLRVAVASRPYTARVYGGVDGVSDLLVLDRSGLFRGLSRRASAFAALRADGGVLLPPSFSAALTLCLGHVPHRVGYRTDGRAWLLATALPTGGHRDEHLTENYVRLGRALLARLRLDEPPPYHVPRVRVFDGERRAVSRELSARGVRRGEYAVVIPGATYGPTKSWPAEKYRDLVGRLVTELPVVLAGSASERVLCDSVLGGTTGAVNLAGETGLGELFALLEGARVVVANDSGAPHVASSLGVPVAVVFGSTSPTWTRPIGSAVNVIREPVHCSPCFRSECPTQLECYAGIDVERVLDAALAAMNDSGTGAVDGSAIDTSPAGLSGPAIGG